VKNFLLKLLVFSLCIAAGNVVFQLYAPERFAVKHLWAVFAFFVGITFLFHSVITKAAQGSPQAFVRKYMGITAFRLFFFIIIIVVYRLAFGKEQAIPFAIAFLAHYFLFTIFEVAVLLRQLK
jgi:hypothetical protein